MQVEFDIIPVRIRVRWKGDKEFLTPFFVTYQYGNGCVISDNGDVYDPADWEEYQMVAKEPGFFVRLWNLISGRKRED